MSIISQQVTLVSRPNGSPKLTDFKLIETKLPELKEGEVLLKTKYFSLDPYMRPRMNAAKGSYIASFQLNTVLDGAAISVVEQTKSEHFQVGDIVLNETGWQTHAIRPGKLSDGMSLSSGSLTKLPDNIKTSYFLGALGMTGLTAYEGLLKIGQPKAGETVVVSAATGAVGSMVGQLAKLQGCRVVGIAGGKSKCDYAVQELGFDDCIDYKDKSFKQNLKKACPNKIDIYFENVGGTVFNTVLSLLNNFARIPVCGLISYYNDGSTLQQRAFSIGSIFAKIKAVYRMFLHFDQTPLIFSSILGKRIKIQGFIISDYFDAYGVFLKETMPLIQSGQIKVKEDVVKGIENSPEAFIGLLQGKNFGKLVIEV